MKLMRELLLLAWFSTSASAAKAITPCEDVFAPFRTEVAALSPDGRYVAYSLRDAGSIYIVTVAVDSPEQAIVRVRVADDDLAVGYHEPDFIHDKGIPRIFWMQWISPTRIAVETNLTFLKMGGIPQGALYVFDFDGRNARRLYSAKTRHGSFLARRLNPANEREILARSDDGEIAIDVDSGESRKLKDQEIEVLAAAVKARRLQSREFEKKVNEDLKKLLPDHKLTLPESLGSSPRILVRAESVADPGGFLVYEPSANRLWDFVRRIDLLPPDRRFRTEAFEFKNAEGRLFSGLITLPLNPHILKAPLVLFIPDKLGVRASRDYRPEVHAFAAMGFAVAVVDGFHASNAIPNTENIVEGQEIDHQVQSIDILADHFAVSRKAVALFGEKLAGRRAVELAAMRPGFFRCLVVLAPAALGQNTEKILAQSRVQSVESALIFAWPGSNPARGSTGSLATATLAAGTMNGNGVDVTLIKVGDAFQGGQTAARAEVFRAIEAFLTEHLYHYSVQIGETIEVKNVEAKSPP